MSLLGPYQGVLTPKEYTLISDYLCNFIVQTDAVVLFSF